MRIVIDLQAAQSTGSRNRGIGRYSLSLAQAMVRNRGEHEVFIALSGLFPATIEPIRAAFFGFLPSENIQVWHGVSPVSDLVRSNDWRRQSAELVREAFLASLEPDIVHVMSIFEGLDDDAVTSIGKFANLPTAVTLYDLIPFIHRSPYLDNATVEAWYLRKLDHFRRADLWLAISESSRQEGLSYLNLQPSQVVNISTAADAHFKALHITNDVEREIRQKYGLPRPFVMYTGGIDHRKNIDGLIRAFALLPQLIRREYQLAIVCSARPDDKQNLLNLAIKAGLAIDDLILTGFVPEEDLVLLYNICKLFVFPSWHEGFGLPALEAMSCGAPVIGANTSSLPEVIGWAQALFDPRSDNAIASAMERALCDDLFRAELVSHGQKQATNFSWDESAKEAIAAFERFHAEKLALDSEVRQVVRRPKLAYVSPLPPARSGIADYSAELLPELARYYEIEMVVTQTEVSDSQITASWPLRSVAWFAAHATEYERVLYHFGNSEFHSHMFDLLAAIPGVIVLHDFFLSGILAHMDGHGFKPGGWINELYHAHGYHAVQECFLSDNIADVIWKYPCNLSVMQNGLGVIVHSEHSRSLARQWYGAATQRTEWTAVPLLRQAVAGLDRRKARAALGFKENDFVVCSFGIMGPTKLNHRLLNAWLRSRLLEDQNCYLVFVGENHPGEYGQQILTKILNGNTDSRVQITGWVDTDIFRNYLTAADVGVQLRTLSRGETSAAVLDCMNYGLATVVNANGSMVDLAEHGVVKLPDEFLDEELVHALEDLWQNHPRRLKLGGIAKEIIREIHSPRRCAKLYRSAIERYYNNAETGIHALSLAVANIIPVADSADLKRLAEALSQSISAPYRARQLLVDVSESVQGVGKGKNNLVVRSILREWLLNVPEGIRIEPVYCTIGSGYRYARRFTCEFLGCPDSGFEDSPVDYATGDIFIGFDFSPQVVVAQREFFQKMRRQGVVVKFVVYDLLPICLQEVSGNGFSEEDFALFRCVAESDGAVCISKAVENELKLWIKSNMPQCESRLNIDCLNILVNIPILENNTDFSEYLIQMLSLVASRPSFLMLGSAQMDKGCGQALAAFEQIWRGGNKINLVIVGKPEWMVGELLEIIRSHCEQGRKLFWVETISDIFLEKLFLASTCLIATSEGEDFGFSLIEAAQHNLPIIACDIPVFREVAGEHAFYFTGHNADDFSLAIEKWLQLYMTGEHPKSDAMSWLTWKQGAKQLLQCVLPVYSTQEA